MAQLNRASEDRPGRRPRLSDLRESGGIEADADVVMLLHRPETSQPARNGRDPGRNEENIPDDPAKPELIEVLIEKQRNGPTGELILAYRKPFMRFESFAPEYLFDGSGRGQ